VNFTLDKTNHRNQRLPTCRQRKGEVVMRVSGRIGVSVLVALLTIGICYAEAWGVFDKARAIVHNERGAQYLEKGQYDQAITEFTKAIELDPKFAWAYNNRGNAYAQGKGQLDQAISDFTKAIELDPKLAKAYNNRGGAYGDKGQYDQAISDCNKAIELNPEYAQAYYNRGRAYLQKGQLDQAISDYTKAIELNPEIAMAYLNRAITYAIKGEYDKAWEDVHKAQSLGFQVHPGFLKDLREASPEKSTGSREACEEDCKQMFEKGELRQGMTVEECIKGLCE
jgi:tetratricopeptide (TPR) repeat protein